LLVGQTGVGGGALMTPILVLVFGISPAAAVGTDLLYAAVTKGAGTLVHGLSHTVDWRLVRRLASGSLPGTGLTLLLLSELHLGRAAQSHIISVVLGVVLILTALTLVARGQILAIAGPLLEALTPARQASLTVIIGALLGILVTLSSVGAGALGVTALLLLYPRAPMARIVGTDIAHAVPLTLLAGLGHWSIGGVNLPLLASLLTGSIPGIVVGSWSAARVPEMVLRPILAVTLAAVGMMIVF
jgi:hypothetical protein